MIDLADLTNAMADTLRRIPELVSILDQQSPNSVIPYVDVQPKLNAFAAAVYSQKPGTVLVAWQETALSEGQGDLVGWLHRVSFYLRAARDQNVYDIIDKIMNGVPNPGDGMRWRYCPVMAGVLPTEVVRLARETDSEQIDLITIETETKETSDA